MRERRNTKRVASTVIMLFFLFSLSACKEFAKDVGDAGNEVAKSIKDAIERNKD